ncbi:hypothetical protein R3P38DRAFT_3201500 [Favolaschia claudopus]|uniref:Uncharacterized protein n=1 Tax=Favolaschia claudopus TaxID=2862362 RepID=A0AAW0AWW6_9AGAR
MARRFSIDHKLYKAKGKLRTLQNEMNQDMPAEPGATQHALENRVSINYWKQKVEEEQANAKTGEDVVAALEAEYQKQPTSAAAKAPHTSSIDDPAGSSPLTPPPTPSGPPPTTSPPSRLADVSTSHISQATEHNHKLRI